MSFCKLTLLSLFSALGHNSPNTVDGPGLTKRNFRLGSMADCVETATTGTFQSFQKTIIVPGGVDEYMPKIPTWLSRCTTKAKDNTFSSTQHQRRTYTSSTKMGPLTRIKLVRRIARLVVCKS